MKFLPFLPCKFGTRAMTGWNERQTGRRAGFRLPGLSALKFSRIFLRMRATALASHPTQLRWTLKSFSQEGVRSWPGCLSGYVTPLR